MKNRPKDSTGQELYINDLCRVLEPAPPGKKSFVKSEDGEILLVTIQQIHGPETRSDLGNILVISLNGLSDSRLIESTRLIQEESIYGTFSRILDPLKMAEKLAELPKLVAATSSKKKKKAVKKKDTVDQDDIAGLL